MNTITKQLLYYSILLMQLSIQLHASSFEQDENIWSIDDAFNRTSTEIVFKNNQVTVYVQKTDLGTYIICAHQNGDEIKINKNHFVAIHEAAHVVAFTNIASFNIVENSSIVDNATAAGTTTIQQAYRIKKNILELEHEAIGYLAGGVANQLQLQIPLLTTSKEIDAFFSNQAYQEDWIQAYRCIDKIIRMQPHDTSIYKLLLHKKVYEIYYKTYNFIMDNQVKITKIAQALLNDTKISRYEIYKLLGQDLPLYDFEQGPLPFSLQHHYNMRNRMNNDTEKPEFLSLFILHNKAKFF